MAKRKHDDDGAGTGADMAPKRKKKNRLREQQQEEAANLLAMEILKQEPGVTGEDEFEKGKKNGKKGVDDSNSRPVSTPESEKKSKKKIKQEEAAPLEDLQPVEYHGSAEPQRKKKKKSKDGVPEASTSQIVQDDGGAERQRKKKKTKEVPVTLDVVDDNQGNTKKSRKEVVPVVDASQDVEDGQGKKKKMKKEVVTVEASHVQDDQGNKKMKMKEVPVTVDALQVVEDDQGKKKNKMKGVPVTVDALQVVEDDQRKKKKKKKTMKEVPVTVDSLQDVEDVQGKKKKNKNKMKEVAVTVDALQVEGDQGKKKKRNKGREEVAVTVDALQVEDDQGKKNKGKEEVSVTVDALQVVEDDQGKKNKKMTKEVLTTPVIEDGQGKKKKKKTKKVVPTPDFDDGQGKGKEVVTLEVPQTDADGQGKKKGKVISKDPSVKKTILKSESNGAELDRKREKKQVTFQLPDRVEDELLEKELPGEEEIEYNLEELSWKADRLRPGLIYGMYTPEEDGVLKKAIFDYIQEQGWDREEGLEKILNSKTMGVRGCWNVIRKCLPKRELKRLHSRAHRLLGPNTHLGKWSNEESRSLMALQAVHGNDWKRLAKIVGRDPDACKDKWRQLRYTYSENYKRGSWSEEELQNLCKLVLKCLHVKAEMAKKGLLTKTHRVLREEISWTFIAEQMDGRSRLDCMNQWYNRMASPMVTTGEWSNFDDERLLERLMEEFPLSEELVEWDSLLEHRSGETCKKRWEQMQRTLGRAPAVRHQHFLERMEGVIKRFAPHLLDPEYDHKFADDMQRADNADESDDADV